jgi:peptidyl-prolyl cis-trans isomerase D
MLEALREKSKGRFAIVLLVFLALLIGLSGIQGYVISSANNAVASVGEENIDPTTFQRQWSTEAEQLRRQGIDETSISSLQRKREFLDRVIDRELLRQSGENAGLVPSLELLQKQIAGIAGFQVNEKFDQALYQQVLAQNRLTETEFLQSLRQDYQSNALPSSFFQSALVTDADIDDFVKLRDQTRDFNVFSIDTNDLPAPAAISAEEVKKYYEANKDKFLSEEQADFETLRVSPADLKPAEITEQLLKDRYEQQATRFKTPETRQASHILIEVEGGANASPEAQKVASEKAAALASRARAGEDFAALARAESKDLGSAAAGGDLGMLEKGVTQPAFESKLFSMQINEISDPVLTDDGYHVIKLVAVEAERGKSFEEARVELESEVRQEEVSRAYNQLTGKLIDSSQRDPQTLANAAKELGLEIKRTGLIGRAGGSDPMTQNPEFLKTAFADRVLRDGQNSGLVKLGENDGVVLRVAVHKKAEPKALDLVKADIELQLANEKRAAALKARASELLKEITGGKSFADVAAANRKTVENVPGAGRNSVNRAPELTADVFKAAPPTGGKANYLMSVQGQDRISLVELLAVKDGDVKSVDQASRDAIRQQLKSERSATEFFGLQKALKARTQIEVFEDRLADM